MKSTALFRSVTRNANRFDAIVRVLAKCGLADWIRDGNPEFVKERFNLEDGRSIADMPPVERVRLAFTARLGLTLLLSFVALPVLAQKVKVDLDRDYAFGDIDTYAWTELDRGELSGSAHDRITATVEKELDAAGLSKAEPGDVPDVLVTYLANTTELPVDADDPPPNDAPDALVIVLRDASDQSVFFQGVAPDALEAKRLAEEERLEKAVRKMLKRLQQRIEFSTPDLQPFAGRPVKAVDIQGHRSTKDYVIRREIRLPLDEPLDLAAVDEDVARLDNLSIFAQIRVDAEEEDDGVRVQYQFKELPPFIPFPAFSYTEENGFSFGGGLSAGNMTGRDISVSGRALFGGTTTYRLELGWPWITGNHVSFTFYGAHLDRIDEVRGFNEISDEITPWLGTYFAGDRGRLKGTLSYFKMQSDVDGVTVGEDNEDRLHRIGVAVGWDTRDSWNTPTRGWLNEVQFFRTGGFLGGESTFSTVDFDVRRFQPLGEGKSLAMGSLLTLQSGEAFVDVPSYFRYHVGGANTIRGYSVEDSSLLSGKNQWLATAEYRQTVLPPRRWDIFRWSFSFGLALGAFADVGTAWDVDDQFSENLRGGIGVGIRLLVPGAEMTRFDLGWSPEGGFQFHFGVLSKFANQRRRLR